MRALGRPACGSHIVRPPSKTSRTRHKKLMIPCVENAGLCAVSLRLFGGIGLGPVGAIPAPHNEPHSGSRSVAEGHRRTLIGSHPRRWRAFARGGAYTFGGGSGSRTGGGSILSRMARHVRTRADSGYRSSSIARLSSLASASFFDLNHQRHAPVGTRASRDRYSLAASRLATLCSPCGSPEIDNGCHGNRAAHALLRDRDAAAPANPS
jgi:hypothetical protein